MAVFTKVSKAELTGLIKCYFRQFRITRFEGITTGIENSNFFLDLQLPERHTQWVLTIFEMSDTEVLPSIVKLTQYLANKRLPVPAAINDQHGNAVQNIAGKSCVLVPRVTGQHIVSPSVGECQQIGRFLGQMHLNSSALHCKKTPPRDIKWLRRSQQNLLTQQPLQLSVKDRLLLEAEISYASQLEKPFGHCPKGWVHGDLFVDNALFDLGQLTGIIDFYHACHDYLINDLAIAGNDWCYQLGQGYKVELMEALLAGYQEQRQLSESEKKLWPDALRVGALKFWVSRLVSKYTNTYQKGAMYGQVFKDPEEKKQKVLAARKVASLV